MSVARLKFPDTKLVAPTPRDYTASEVDEADVDEWGDAFLNREAYDEPSFEEITQDAIADDHRRDPGLQPEPPM